MGESTMLVGAVVANKVNEIRSKVSVSTAGTDDESLKELSGFLMQIVGRVAVEVVTRDNGGLCNQMGWVHKQR
jgi:hypothetical protein